MISVNKHSGRLRAIAIIALLFPSLHFCFGQAQPKAVLFNTLEEGYCSEILVMTLDSFLYELSKNPSGQGRVLFHGKEGYEGRNLLYFQEIRFHIKQRQFDPNRISFVRGEDTDKMLMQFWIIPAGADPPKLEKPFVKKPIRSATRFDAAWADWHKWDDSHWTIYSYSFADWGCEANLNVKGFAEAILSQSDLTGYLIVYTASGKGPQRAKTVTDFAIKELTKEYKVPKGRIRTIYGGHRKEPQLELWLIPDGTSPPSRTPEGAFK